MSEKPHNGYLEEYKELRAEIRHYLDRRAKNINFAFAITTAVVGVSDTLQTPYIFIVANLFSVFLWYDEIRRYRALQRVGCYLELFVEPKVEGLNWETLGAKHPIQTSIFDRIVANGVFPLIYLINAYLTVYYVSNTSLKLALGIVYPIILILLVIKSIKTLRAGRTEEINKWQTTTYNT